MKEIDLGKFKNLFGVSDKVSSAISKIVKESNVKSGINLDNLVKNLVKRKAEKLKNNIQI